MNEETEKEWNSASYWQRELKIDYVLAVLIIEKVAKIRQEDRDKYISKLERIVGGDIEVDVMKDYKKDMNDKLIRNKEKAEIRQRISNLIKALKE